MGLTKAEMAFGEEKQSEFRDLRAKAFNMDPFLLYQKFQEIDTKFKSIFPDIEKVSSYKKYSDCVNKYFSDEGADTVMEEGDTRTLSDVFSKGIIYSLDLMKNKDHELYKEVKTEFKLLSETFNEIADNMYESMEFEGSRNYKQFIADRKIEAQAERERINSAQPEPEAKKEEMSFETCELYSAMLNNLKRELKATNSKWSHDSDEYKNLENYIVREDLRHRTTVQNEEMVIESFTKLSELADKYLAHVPQKPSSRQKNRSDICKTIKAIANIAQKKAPDPRAALEKQFLKILVYNEDPAGYMQHPDRAADRAAEIYTNPQSRAEISKLSICQLATPSKKDLTAITKKYDEAVKQEQKEANAMQMGM